MKPMLLAMLLVACVCVSSCTSTARKAAPPGSLPSAFQAIDSGDAARLKSLLKAGVDANTVRWCSSSTAYRGRSLLDHAVARGQVGCVKALLAAGAGLSVRDDAGWTPLHRTCCREEADPEVINALIAAGADVNARDKMGRTPLVAALATGQVVAETMSAYPPLFSGRPAVKARPARPIQTWPTFKDGHRCTGPASGAS